MCYFLGLTRQQPDVILNHVMFEINYLFEISFSRMPVDQAQVVQTLDNTIHRINHFQWMDRGLSGR